MEDLSVYIPSDRRKALAGEKKLPDRAVGAALFVDISGFTPLTEALSQAFGPKRGAEEIASQLNRVYDALLVPIERHGGSVIGLSGDAMTCWFDKDDGLNALACAFEMQEAMADFASITIPGQQTVALSVKIAVVTGPVRRFLVGDPAVRYMDVIAGETLDRLARCEGHAKKGEVVTDAATAKTLGRKIKIPQWRSDRSGKYGVVSRIDPEAMPRRKRSGTRIELSEERVRPWLIPAVYERLKHGEGGFLAELRTAVPVFLGFSGIDYDSDPAAGAKLDAYIRWVQRIFAKYDGNLLELTIGDKGSYIYGAFGAPVAHDDDALRAIGAAQELRTPPPDLKFIRNTRIGVSRGRMRAGPYGGTTRRSYSAIGDETNLAARLMQKAEPGQVIVSEKVADAVKGRHAVEAMGAVKLKGKAEPTNIYGLVAFAARTDLAHRQTSIVGRSVERRALQDQLEKLVHSGSGGLILIEGDAGIGKSRLVEELVDQARSAGADCLVGAGDSIEQATLYHAWKPVFLEALNLNSIPDDAAKRAEHVVAWLKSAGEDLASSAPLFSAVAPLEIPENETTALLNGQVRAETTRDFLAKIIAHRMQKNPLVLVIEDAHWLDSSSWALAQRVAALSGPLMFVLVARPMGERAPQEYQQIANATSAKRFALEPLESADALELVKQRLGVRELPSSVAELIQQKAEGNPFFSEELAYALRDAKLIIVHDGVCELAPDAPDLNQMNFPDKVEDVIISRIDLLAPSQQLALKVASVIGRIFAYQTLSEIHPVHEDVPRLAEDLGQLSRVDLTPLEAPDPDLTYMFKHIITQEVSYNLMLFEQRRQLHRAIAEWFEMKHAEDLAVYYPVLAYHWNKVAEDNQADSAVIAKAISYLFKAGEQAIQNYANPEATAHLKNALALLQKLPPSLARDQQEMGMQTMLAYSLVTQRGYGDPEVEAAYRRANALSEKMQDSAQLGFILYGMFSFYASRAEYSDADLIADRLVEIATKLNDQPLLAVGYQSKGIVAFCQGNLRDALEFTQKSYDIADTLDTASFFQFGGDFQAYTSAWLALSRMLLGYPDTAQKIYDHALAITEKQPYPHCFVLGFAFISQLKHDMPAIQARAEELIGLSQKYSFILLGLQGNIFRAWLMTIAAKEPMGAQILKGITAVPKMVKLDSFVPWYLSLLAEAEASAGKPDAALQAIDEAIAYAERAGGNFYQAELQRVKGSILQAMGQSAVSVESCYRDALVRSQSQGAKWWELRAAASLSGLLQAQGRGEEARELLGPVCRWFEEGLETTDLIQARSLLDTL